MTVRLEVSHETRYAYSAPVSLAHHLAHLQPLQDEGQRLESFALHMQPTPAQQAESVDAQGNVQCHFSLSQPHAALLVRAVSTVELVPRFAHLQAEAGPACADIAARLRYVAGAALRAASGRPAHLWRPPVAAHTAGGRGGHRADAPHPCRLRL
jgi:hypothetical protein